MFLFLQCVSFPCLSSKLCSRWSVRTVAVMPGAKSPVPVPAGEATSIPVHKEHIPCFHIDFAETWGDGGGGVAFLQEQLQN